MGPFPTKTSFIFQKFISICSGGAPKTMTKTRKTKHGEFLEKQPQRSLLFSQIDTCVKYERFFCALALSNKNLFKKNHFHMFGRCTGRQ
jgi:uncharacterized protein VirK/YbjX